MIAQTIILVGSSGSGKTTICKYLSENDKFIFFTKHTTRARRISEKNGFDYIYISDEEFTKMQNNNEFAHIKISDFDSSKYGVSKQILEQNLKLNKCLLFSSHGIDEAYNLHLVLQTMNVSCKMIYFYMPENIRFKVLDKKGEKNKYFYRLYMDRGLKITAYRTNFNYCDCVILNNLDKNNLIDNFENYIKGKSPKPLNMSIIKSDILSMNSILSEID